MVHLSAQLNIPAAMEVLPGFPPAAAAADAVLQLMGSTGPIKRAMLGSLSVHAYDFSVLRSLYSRPVVHTALLLPSLACSQGQQTGRSRQRALSKSRVRLFGAALVVEQACGAHSVAFA
jgi:hypothetical protein